MHELPEHREAKVIWTWQHHAVSASMLILGYVLAQLTHATPGPMVTEKERVNEVPVDPIFDRRVPDEAAKNVDSLIDKLLYMRQESLVNLEKPEPYYAKYAEQPDMRWSDIRKGMSRAQVLTILGQPLRSKEEFFEEWFYAQGTAVSCVVFFRGAVIHWSPP